MATRHGRRSSICWILRRQRLFTGDYGTCRALQSPRHPRQRRNGPVCCWLTSFAAYGARLTMHCQWECRSSFSVFVPGDLDLWPLTLSFKLFWARDQTRLPCEFGAIPLNGIRDIWSTSKKSHTALKTEPNLRAVSADVNIQEVLSYT